MSDAPPPFDSAQPFETMTAPAFDPSKPFSPFKTAEPEEEGLKLPPAITDIPKEIAAEAKAGASDVAGVMNRGKMGAVEALTSVPKAAFGAARVLASPVTGAISSVGGHALTNIERGFGEHVVNPLMEHFGYKAQHPDEAEMYETAKGDVNKAMMAARPYGATLKPPGLMPYEPKLLEAPGVPPREPTPPPAPEPPMQEPPRQTMRPDAGVDLLAPDVPHTPASGIRIRSLSAAGPGGPLSDISPETQAYLRKIMEDQGLNQNTLDDRLADMSAHHFFGEITPSLEADMGAIAAPPGPGKQEVLGSIRQRGTEKLERLQNTFDRAFGQNENVAQLNRLIDIDKQKAATPIYQQFRQTAIPPSPEVEAIIPRLRASGSLQAANRALAEEGLPASHGFVEGSAANAFDEGTQVTRVPTAAAFDYAKQHLDGLINSALKNEDAGAVRRYTKMKNDLDAALDAHPTAGKLWQQAREAYGGPTARQDAMRFGQRVLTNHVGADELPFLTAGYNDAQMQALRVGMRKFLEDKLGSRREVSADIFTSTLSPNNIQKIRWAIGDQAADELVTGMHHELHMHGAPTRIHGGSPTAHRLEAQKRWTVQPAAEGLTSDLGIKDLLHPAKTGAKKAIEAVTKMGQAKKLAAAEAKAAKLREEAARVFTLQGPERDAAARHLLGGEGGTPRARGGRVSTKKTARARASGGAVRRAIRASKGYAEGGAPGDDYNTAVDEPAFQAWKSVNAPRDSGYDYDMRGAYKAGFSADPKTHHWPDTYKKPNHDTFSDESMYATGANRDRAGFWTGPGHDVYVPPAPMADGGAPELSDDDQAAMMPETFANPYLKQTLASSLQPSPPRDENVRFRTASPLVNITDEDIDRGVNVGMASGPGSIKGVGPGIRAYHGSPHDFEKFDLSKIGTGEGAQAYGHGLYFAENEGVAKSYRDALAGEPKVGMTSVFDDQPWMNNSNKGMAKGALQTALSQGKTGDEAVRAAMQSLTDMGHIVNMSDRRAAASYYDASNSIGGLLGKEWHTSPGKMYEVNINADPSHFLDWDKPLSQQHPIVQDALKQYGVDPQSATLGQAFNKVGDYPRAANRDQVVQQKLGEAGIPGIKYLDQGSRLPRSISDLESRISKSESELAMWNKLPNDKLHPAMTSSINDELADLRGQLAAAKATPQSSNYVVFNHDLIDIVRKYALAGIALPPAIAAEYEKMQNGRASGGAVSRAVRASKGYAEGGAPDLSEADEAAMMPETYVNPLVKGMGTATGNVVKGLSRDIPRAAKWFYEQAKMPDEQAQAQVRAGLGNAAQDLLSLPERTIRSADVYQRTGEYDPGPVLEAATYTMGTGAIAGVPLKGSEHVLGAGLVRRAAGKEAGLDAGAINWNRERVGLGGPPVGDDRVVMDLPVRDLEAAHKATDPGMFIEKPRQQVLDHMEAGKPISLPEVSVYNGQLRYVNGRNRVAAAREMGADTVPVAVDRDSVGALQDLLQKHAQPETGAAEAASRGLSFPADEAADRLRLKLGRHQKAEATGTELPGAPANDRTVVRAPEGSNLPDFVAGKVTPEDWIARHEQILSPDEIHKSAKWYDEIYGQFLNQTHGDEAKAAKYMRGWLVAQQNVDVSGAMGNALLQREQIARGMREADMKASGMPNPTIAARRVMQDRPIEAGVGQKIADFVDAAEGKDVRSWMGNKPEGGKPFVVDVHTARDTGMVDQELLNHLKRLGYNEEDMKGLKTDLGTSPSQTQYENRAAFGHDLTDYLNKKNWMGRDDWTPKEVQAVGWMGMTKLTANKADDVVTGLQRNMRHLSMELSPGEGSPWAQKYGDRFAALPADKQYAMTHQLTQSAIDKASQLAGVDVRDIVHATGGWQNFQNPSTVAQTFASKTGAEIAANALGHMLQQTEVWANKVKSPTTSPKGFAVDFIGEGSHALGTDEGLRDFWGKVMQADPTGKLFQGYQPIVTPDGKVGIRALIDRGGAGTKKALEDSLAGPIDKMLRSMPDGQHYTTQLHEAEITKARNDWTKDKNGNGYTQRLVDLLGRDPTADLNSHGKKLEEEFRKALESAEGAKAKQPKGKPAPKKVGAGQFRLGGGVLRAIVASRHGP